MTLPMDTLRLRNPTGSFVRSPAKADFMQPDLLRRARHQSMTLGLSDNFLPWTSRSCSAGS